MCLSSNHVKICPVVGTMNPLDLKKKNLFFLKMHQVQLCRKKFLVGVRGGSYVYCIISVIHTCAIGITIMIYPWVCLIGSIHQDRTRGQAVKAENLEGQAVKGITQIRKSQGSSTERSTGYKISSKHDTTPSIRSSQRPIWVSSGQGPKLRSKILTAVVGVSTESIGVTSPCPTLPILFFSP